MGLKFRDSHVPTLNLRYLGYLSRQNAAKLLVPLIPSMADKN